MAQAADKDHVWVHVQPQAGSVLISMAHVTTLDMLVSKGQTMCQGDIGQSGMHCHSGPCIIRAWATSKGQIWVLGCATVLAYIDVCDSCCHKDSDDRAAQNWFHPSLAVSLKRTASFH